MIDFLRNLFLPPPRSSETAKQRLRVVLLSDHLSLAPETVDALKRDLLEVISRYVEIDPVHADVSFEQREREVAMLANIPITGVRDWPRPNAPPAQSTSTVHLQATEQLTVAVQATTEPSATEAELPIGATDIEAAAPVPSDDVHGEAPTLPAEPTATPVNPPPKPARASHTGAPRRRRRRKAAAQAKVTFPPVVAQRLDPA